MSTVFVTGGSGFLGGALVPALAASGHRVVALARGEAAAIRVSAVGATAVRGEIADKVALTAAMRGCDAVIHAAARMHGGKPHEYHADNVAGTRTVLHAARAVGVGRFVHVGAAGCLVDGRRTIVDADESWPLCEPRFSAYLSSKTRADRDVLAANRSGFSTSVVRPGWVWGAGDPMLDQMAAAARDGKMVLIAGGRHPIVTSHRDNTVLGILAALAGARGGEAYYLFDDGTVPVGEFLTALLRTRGLPAPARSIPYRLARTLAAGMEAAHRLARRPGDPPILRLLVELNGRPFVVSDGKARAQLGYRPARSREDGLAQMAAARPSRPDSSEHGNRRSRSGCGLPGCGAGRSPRST
jgi:nucleoside-diphosphate-sugar epimerase